ncbi:M20/M25/M40 family metallo-hydrolase [Treponema sp. HNW]|uniref:M20/M25/M40 family metallo-hydrolase n=1 Tax=Treponema sp. HNW TaxID=3116654 RepID=UPI003D0A2F95
MKTVVKDKAADSAVKKSGKASKPASVKRAALQLSSPAERLAHILRIPSVSLPAERDTREADIKSDIFDTLHSELKRLYPSVFKTCERIKVGRYPLLLRLRGKDSSSCIVLTAHQDTVPAPEKGWNYEPFGGVIADGAVWGRGAIDDKGSLCAILEACETLAADGFTPSVDIYLAFSHNEETMGWGACALVEELERRAVKPLFVLDEGGAVVEKPLPMMSGKAAMIGITEKGVADIGFYAQSTGGHASTPPRKSPLGRLGAFAASVEKNPPFKARVSSALCAMLSSLSKCMGFPFNILFRFPRLFAPLIRTVFKAAGGSARALVQTSCAFTMARGSDAVNVLPSNAFFTANLRIAGGDTTDGVLASLQKRASRFGVRAELLRGHEASPESELNRGWNLLCAALEKEFPNTPAVPYIMLAASDSRHYCKICSAVYRFTPFEMSNVQRESVHGINEHMEIDNFERGIRFYRELIRSV